MDAAALSNSKRSRDDSDISLEETTKRIRADFLIDVDVDGERDTAADFLIDVDVDGERDTAAEDIAWVMKSLEDEIGFSPSLSPLPVAVDELPRLELGYLLEASDDELGLPPTAPVASASGEADESAVVLDLEIEGGGFGQIWEMEDEILRGYGNGMGFDYCSTKFFVEDDFSDFSCPQETLPAVW